MEVKKNVKAGKTAAPISNNKQKAASRLKVKTTIKAGAIRIIRLGYNCGF